MGFCDSRAQLWRIVAERFDVDSDSQQERADEQPHVGPGRLLRTPQSVAARTPVPRPAFETRNRTTHVSSENDDTAPPKKTTQGVNQARLRQLREVLKLVGFHSKTHFKVDVKPDAGYLWIRQFRSEYGEPQTIAGARSRLNLLDSAARMEPERFRAELEEWLKENGFQL